MRASGSALPFTAFIFEISVQAISWRALVPWCLMLTGCANSKTEWVAVEDTAIAAETKIGSLAPDDQKLLIALSKGVDGDQNVFNKAKAVSVNGYRIVYAPGADTLYIVKNKKPIASVSAQDEAVRVYGDSAEAPAFGSERAEIQKNYIAYTGPKSTFEDYGLDSVDAVSEPPRGGAIRRPFCTAHGAKKISSRTWPAAEMKAANWPPTVSTPTPAGKPW